jgi:hypothetical protein
VLIVILAKAFECAKKGLTAVLVYFLAAYELSTGAATALSVMLVALVCFLAGLLARTVPAQHIVNPLESAVLSKIPAYEFLKQESASALGAAQTTDLPVSGKKRSPWSSYSHPFYDGLNCFKPRSNGTHSVGEFSLGYQPAAEHRMDQCEQLTLRRRNVAIHRLSKLVLSSAPIKGRKRPADC